ncbi:MAG: carboxynorspermidine decarboxylase [Thermodesulfobacteriota bacterium]|nr:carboxynorspermidine decarboxylase [Thermodesulfobacteriota bacterium]
MQQARESVKMDFNINDISTPCYVIDRGVVEENLKKLAGIKERSGCRILLSLKAFAMFSLFPLIREYLDGASVSSLNEARLAHEEFGGEIHVYVPAYKESEFGRLLKYSDFMIFNSFSQWHRFEKFIKTSSKKVSFGIRINPEHSEVEARLYDTCDRFSRLGVRSEQLRDKLPDRITGLHFHSLCCQNSDVLERTLKAVEQKFGNHLHKIQWLNLGGGHHIVSENYDIDLLCSLITGIRERYGVRIYLEPGEAVVLDAGVLAATVLDIVHNEMDIALLDTSAVAHMPDVFEMPYRPDIVGAGIAGEYNHTYRLGGITCLAGDVIGDYSFPEPLEIGSRIIIRDMAHYTMVRNSHFNGVKLPDIAIHDPGSGKIEVVRRFGYEDFKNRLS